MIITITVNGELRQVPGDTTIAGLLRELGIAERRVAVECNREIVRKERYGQSGLGDGDVLEIIEFVGGG